MNLSLSKGPNRIGVSLPHMRTETDPVAEPLCFIVSRIPDDGRSPNPPVILSVTHHRQNILESLPLWFYSPCGPRPLFQFLNPIHSRYDSLDGGSARRKAATYTNTN
jgi:hypothetical protein